MIYSGFDQPFAATHGRVKAPHFMSNIEIIICLVLVFMGVPDLCRKLGRPALVFSAFVLFGMFLKPLILDEVQTMLKQAGEVGFLLLLFEVGLEIDLPKLRQFIRPLYYALIWILVQYPLVFGLGLLAGMDWKQCLLAGTALTACSVGMAYPAWKCYPNVPSPAKEHILQCMVALEMMAILALALETTALGHGLSWMIPLKLVGIAIVIFLIARFASHLQSLFQTILDRATHWRLHWLVLLVLLVSAMGERLGLGAAKTAFFLGLALSRAGHDGVPLEKYMAPLSHRFLIPVFFVALGLQIEWQLLKSPVALLAMGTAGLLFGTREILHRRWLKTGADHQAFLLFCPNLTLVALASKALLDNGGETRLATWLVLTGLFMTIPSLLMLPSESPAKSSKKSSDHSHNKETLPNINRSFAKQTL